MHTVYTHTHKPGNSIGNNSEAVFDAKEKENLNTHLSE